MSDLKTPLQDMLSSMADPRKDILIKIYNDHKDLFHKAAGSGHNHQAWSGGYADHIAEALRVNAVTYAALSRLRPLDFTQDSATIALFFHDIEKPFRYGPADDPRCTPWQKKCTTPAQWEDAKWDILNTLKTSYGFELTEAEINAIKYTHGEGKDYRKDARVSTPLAAHAHHCDNTSARIWPEDGQGLS